MRRNILEEKTFHIGEIADFFGIPASTLRYWEENGLISPEKNEENNYREYSAADLMSLSDIIFYKNLGLPLKQIRKMDKTDIDEQRKLFEGKIEELERQKETIDRKIQELDYHISAIKTMVELEKHPFHQIEIDTECIVPFELVEMEKIKQYISNPYLYSRVQHSSNLKKEQRGLTIPADLGEKMPDREILWKKGNHSYVSCLMRERVTKGYPNNLAELLAKVQETYETGYIISRFLFRGQENGEVIDYYKTFIEIL